MIPNQPRKVMRNLRVNCYDWNIFFSRLHAWRNLHLPKDRVSYEDIEDVIAAITELSVLACML